MSGRINFELRGLTSAKRKQIVKEVVEQRTRSLASIVPSTNDSWKAGKLSKTSNSISTTEVNKMFADAFSSVRKR
ncbi:hypothetical protein [Yersinia ruckeri]|uniref:hypothetical protein n=1 Tax=Yersinia ruckeri TaxID=29486 RepID=UPI002238441B|nr:hypothetical protein [Yersinia ruckeri]EKN4689542.1 hypothetical protein [Yersinia ruckeri]MCW6615840.1 hypothetical protein [Yersinia ruckeri]